MLGARVFPFIWIGVDKNHCPFLSWYQPLALDHGRWRCGVCACKHAGGVLRAPQPPTTDASAEMPAEHIPIKQCSATEGSTLESLEGISRPPLYNRINALQERAQSQNVRKVERRWDSVDLLLSGAVRCKTQSITSNKKISI